ncbi:MAG TPA: NTP transferase domain-containing protein [Feifaniaceae bacterium]|nr:NTP transferase domain-containing protein [Feifaniaceae bacterium]
MHTVSVILLAAGEGKRMCSAVPKPLMPLCGVPMMSHVLKAAKALQTEGVPLAVAGNNAEEIKAHYGGRLAYCAQGEQKGPGGALLAALPYIKRQGGKILVLGCDIPLVREETLKALVSPDCAAAFLIPAAGEYAPEVRVNAWCFSADRLPELLEALPAAASGLSMQDIMDAFRKAGHTVQAVPIEAEEAVCVTDRVRLSEAAAVLRRRINRAHMLAGVTMIDPEHTYIDAGVKIGRDCTIYPGVVLEGNTVIGEGTALYPACRIADSQFGKGCAAQGVVAKDAVVGDNVTLGPYVNLRPGANLGNNCKVGNYIEVKNSNVGEGSKLPHLSYIGDGDVGRHVNLGCGTVFVNYDGYKKHRTVIGDNAFIGCHTSLVAPVTVGEGAFTAAGSVITEEVPAGALAVARAKQVNKPGYVAKLRVKRGEVKE